MQPTVHANQDCAGMNGMHINGLCVCTLVPDITLGTQWNVNNIYVSYSRTPEIRNVVHSSATRALYAFVQTPSLRMRERGLGMRLDSTMDALLENGLSHIRYCYHSNIYQWRMVLNTVAIVTYTKVPWWLLT